MGKKLKLKLEDLEVQSFVTSKKEDIVAVGGTGGTIWPFLACSVCAVGTACASDFGNVCYTSPADNCPSAHNTQCGDCPSAFCETPFSGGGCCDNGGGGGTCGTATLQQH